MVGWRPQFSGHELGQTLGDGEGLGHRGVTESDTPWPLNDDNIDHERWRRKMASDH